MRVSGADALLGMLFPVWQLVIAVCLVIVTVIAGHKLLMRGPSRMSRGVVVAGGAILGVVLLSVLFSLA
jgi:hypothetical protein